MGRPAGQEAGTHVLKRGCDQVSGSCSGGMKKGERVIGKGAIGATNAKWLKGFRNRRQIFYMFLVQQLVIELIAIDKLIDYGPTSSAKIFSLLESYSSWLISPSSSKFLRVLRRWTGSPAESAGRDGLWERSSSRPAPS